MAEYTRKMASIFHAFRIGTTAGPPRPRVPQAKADVEPRWPPASVSPDNCHSTPLHVGQYLLDVARSVRPKGGDLVSTVTFTSITLNEPPAAGAFEAPSIVRHSKDAAGAVFRHELGVLGVIRILRLLFRVQVVEVAEPLIEPMNCG